MYKGIKYSKGIRQILICTILIFISVSMFGQDSIKRMSKDIVFKASFENDTLDLTGYKDIIIDFEIKNNSDSVFVFNPNAYVNITEKIDKGLSLDQFGILLDLTTKTEKIVEILPDSLICFKSKFNLQDKNVSVISMSVLSEGNHDFTIAYIPHYDDINRIVLFSKDINATVKKE